MMTLAEALRVALEEPSLRYGIPFEVLHAEDQHVVAILNYVIPPDEINAAIKQCIQNILTGNVYSIEVDPSLWSPQCTPEEASRPIWTVLPGYYVKEEELAFANELAEHPQRGLVRFLLRAHGIEDATREVCSRQWSNCEPELFGAVWRSLDEGELLDAVLEGLDAWNDCCPEDEQCSFMNIRWSETPDNCTISTASGALVAVIRRKEGNYEHPLSHHV